jgi:hypothetical protein
MEYLLLALAGVGGLAWLWVRLRARRTRGRDRARALIQVRKLCDEDIAVLGEELRRLDTESTLHPLDDAAQADHQTAMDAYGSAQREVGRITDAVEISKVTDTLSNGGYALACVQARVAGRPRPVLRVPCFFNPQHGPSVMDMAFTPRGHGTRNVPACAMDVARLRAGEKPDVRMVEVGGRRVPYFEGGAAFTPYGAGYFMGQIAAATLFVIPASWAGEGGLRQDGVAFNPHGLRSDGMFG